MGGCRIGLAETNNGSEWTGSDRHTDLTTKQEKMMIIKKNKDNQQKIKWIVAIFMVKRKFKMPLLYTSYGLLKR
jgi:hypothetical protein